MRINKLYTLNECVGNKDHICKIRNELYKGLSTGMELLEDPKHWNGGISLFVTPLSAAYLVLPCLLVTITNIAKGIFWSLAFLIPCINRDRVKEILSEKFSYLKQDATLLAYHFCCAIPIIGALTAWGIRVEHLNE